MERAAAIQKLREQVNSIAAQVTGMSLNQWATRAIEQAVEGH